MLVVLILVTMITVGYGDIAPHANLGKLLASLMMLPGWRPGRADRHRHGGLASRHVAQRKLPTPKYCSVCGVELV